MDTSNPGRGEAYDVYLRWIEKAARLGLPTPNSQEELDDQFEDWYQDHWWTRYDREVSKALDKAEGPAYGEY